MFKQGFLLGNSNKSKDGAKRSPEKGAAAPKRVAAGKPSTTGCGDTGKSVAWDEVTAKAFLDACREALNHKARTDLERRVRSGTGTECSHASHHACCDGDEATTKDDDGPHKCDAADAEGGSHEHCKHGHHSTEQDVKQTANQTKDSMRNRQKEVKRKSIKHRSFKNSNDDPIGELLDMWTDDDHLRKIAGKVAEKSASIWQGVRTRSKKDGLDINVEDDQLIRREILCEATVREIQSRVTGATREKHKLTCLEGGLLAMPAGYREGPLDWLEVETLRGLMKDGYACQSAYLGENIRKAVFKELELREFDGQFSDTYQHGEAKYHTDHICWIGLNSVDRVTEHGLHRLFTRMVSIPFELNKKASLLLQAAGTFRLSFFPAKASYYRPHFDGGYGTHDLGRKITAVYFPNAEDWNAEKDDGGTVRIYPRRSKRQWEEQNQLGKKSVKAVPESAPSNNSESSTQRNQKKEVPDIEASRDSDKTATQQNAAAGGENDGRKDNYVDIVPGPDTLLLMRTRDMEYEVLECHRKCFHVYLWLPGPIGPGDED